MYQKGKKRARIPDYRGIILTSLPQSAIEKPKRYFVINGHFFGERQPVKDRP